MSMKKVVKITLMVLSALLAAAQTINENDVNIKSDNDHK